MHIVFFPKEIFCKSFWNLRCCLYEQVRFFFGIWFNTEMASLPTNLREIQTEKSCAYPWIGAFCWSGGIYFIAYIPICRIFFFFFSSLHRLLTVEIQPSSTLRDFLHTPTFFLTLDDKGTFRLLYCLKSWIVFELFELY